MKPAWTGAPRSLQETAEMNEFAFAVLGIKRHTRALSDSYQLPVVSSRAPTARLQSPSLESASTSVTQKLQHQLAFKSVAAACHYRSLSNLTLVVKSPQKPTAMRPPRKQKPCLVNDDEAIEHASDALHSGMERQLAALYRRSKKLQAAMAVKAVPQAHRKLKTVSRTILKETLRMLQC